MEFKKRKFKCRINIQFSEKIQKSCFHVNFKTNGLNNKQTFYRKIY